jgi:hypothetical protein
MSEEHEEDEGPDEGQKGLGRLNELDRSGDRAKAVPRRSKQLALSQAQTAGSIPPEPYDLPRKDVEMEKHPLHKETPKSHMEKTAIYASVVLCLASVTLTVFSLLSLAGIYATGTDMFSVGVSTYALLLVFGAGLTFIFAYVAVTRTRQLRELEYLQKRKRHN